jgi:hypothetical protein
MHGVYSRAGLDWTRLDCAGLDCVGLGQGLSCLLLSVKSPSVMYNFQLRGNG